MVTGTAVESAGWRMRSLRVVWAGLLLVTAGVGSYLLFSVTTLRGLPDIGEPFDAARYATVSIPNDENAFTFFRRATDRFVGHESDIATSASRYADWSQIPAEILRSLEQNRESLDLWFEGTKRDRGVYTQPGEGKINTVLPVTQRLRSFTRLASFRAMRLQLDGDYAGAWDWIRANLRSGLLSGQNGFMIERLVGVAIYTTAAGQAVEWADDPRVDAKLLRRALDDTLAMDAIVPVYSLTVRHEYYSIMNTLAEPRLLAMVLTELTPMKDRTWLTPWKERAMGLYGIARREPERSRRVARLILANWLSGCDLPRDERSSRAVQFGQLTLYRPGPGEASPLSPEELARWYETALYVKPFFPVWMNIETARIRDEKARSALIVHMADQLYRREHGKGPASPQDLVGPYLKALPIGYVPPSDDPKPQALPR